MTTGDATAQTSPASHPAKRVKLDESITPNTTATTTTSTTTNTMAAPPLMIKKLSDKARLPTRGSAFAAGYDIYASKATVVPARGKALVDTDISMACPAGTCTLSLLSPSGFVFEDWCQTNPSLPDGRIAPRSGLASKVSQTSIHRNSRTCLTHSTPALYRHGRRRHRCGLPRPGQDPSL